MAFTQGRAIALINAATDLYNIVTSIRNHAIDLKQARLAGQVDDEYAFTGLALFISEANHELYHNFAKSISILTVEHTHFSRNIKRNQAEAARAARRREAKAETTRPYEQHIMSYETDTLIKQIPLAPGMNNRGDLPKSYVQSIVVQPLTQEEYEKALEEATRPKPMFDHQTPDSESIKTNSLSNNPEDKPDFEKEW